MSEYPWQEMHRDEIEEWAEILLEVCKILNCIPTGANGTAADALNAKLASMAHHRRAATILDEICGILNCRPEDAIGALRANLDMGVTPSPRQIEASEWVSKLRALASRDDPSAMVTALADLLPGIAAALEGMTPKPDPRPASELTVDRARAWPTWFLIRKPTGHGDYDGIACAVSVEEDEEGTYVCLPSGDCLEDAFIATCYPIRPDMSKGPIPASWEDVDAKVADMAGVRPVEERLYPIPSCTGGSCDCATAKSQISRYDQAPPESQDPYVITSPLSGPAQSMLEKLASSTAGTGMSGLDRYTQTGDQWDVMEPPGHTDLMVCPETVPENQQPPPGWEFIAEIPWQHSTPAPKQSAAVAAAYGTADWFVVRVSGDSLIHHYIHRDDGVRVTHAHDGAGNNTWPVVKWADGDLCRPIHRVSDPDPDTCLIPLVIRDKRPNREDVARAYIDGDSRWLHTYRGTMTVWTFYCGNPISDDVETILRRADTVAGWKEIVANGSPSPSQTWRAIGPDGEPVMVPREQDNG